MIKELTSIMYIDRKLTEEKYGICTIIKELFCGFNKEELF